MPSDAPRQIEPGVGACPLEQHDGSVLAIEPAKIEQVSVAEIVARMRRRTQQQHVSRAPRELITHIVPLGIAGNGMCFVDHDELPGVVRQVVHDVMLFDVVERCDPDARPAPRVVAVGTLPGQFVEALTVGRPAFEPEAGGQLVDPLIAK